MAFRNTIIFPSIALALTIIKLLALGGIPMLTAVAINDSDVAARRKAIYALSSSVRNYQPSMDVFLASIPSELLSKSTDNQVSAGNMDAIDSIMERLRERSP